MGNRLLTQDIPNPRLPPPRELRSKPTTIPQPCHTVQDQLTAAIDVLPHLRSLVSCVKCLLVSCSDLARRAWFSQQALLGAREVPTTYSSFLSAVKDNDISALSVHDRELDSFKFRLD